MTPILDQIVANKRNEIHQLKQAITTSDYVQSTLFNRTVISLKKNIRDQFGIVAEIKRKSPGAGEIKMNLDIRSQVEQYEKQGASGISVLSDFSYFGGSIEDIKQIRTLTNLPILRKEFILDEYQLFESKAAGADAVLLIASILEKEQAHQLTIVAKSLGLEVLFEIHSFEELNKLNDEVDILLVNNRNLKTQQTAVEHSFELASYLPENILKISASGISNSDQLDQLQNCGFNGALIGESLLKGNFRFSSNSFAL
ncbi:indole-3-glycerol phosphate synthase TrpC [Fluviicola sp.]|uniref:indole-3-glycerol phosphate synthase TrpC n=1 Tax=Fluviicola sp. TaxID=1917219 RepID=UPI002620D31A|nr:indole-3-glycerol phosphate synthase TrpC [Fluviicola sp.]